MSLRTSVYLDRGDNIAGRYDPPRPCRVITIWRPAPHGQRDGRPSNIAVRYLDDGSTAIIPFARRLKRADKYLPGDNAGAASTGERSS